MISLTVDEEQALRAKMRAGTTEHRIAERAKIVLLAHEGKTNLEIAEQLDTRPARVSKWRRRFAELGLNGWLLIHAHYQCVDRRLQIQAHDVRRFGAEFGILTDAPTPPSL